MTEPPPDSSDTDTDTDIHDDVAMFEKRGCCHWLSPGSCWWERITTTAQRDQKDDNNTSSWWAKGIKGLKKVREWSELVAGPKWKTFIRRFGKNRCGNGTKAGGGKFQYDPMSYSLNFDEGVGKDDQFSDSFRDFSSRYASLPIFTKGSMDLGREGPLFA